MNTQLFQGDWVRLTAANPETDAEAVARWTRDSELLRLMSSSPPWPLTVGEAKADQERRAARENYFGFAIRALADDRLLGFTNLKQIAWTHGEACLGINISEQADRGKGYGTDTLHVLLRYAFAELNLYRVSLEVFADNVRAIRSYEKAGFVVEGRLRQAVHRDGRRGDVICMGVLREEWEKSQNLADPRSGAKGTNPKLQN